MDLETDESRQKRRQQRLLFDSVADLYDATRRGYPREIVEFMLATAGVGPGGSILEVGCGTGQLTERLARGGFAVTAIDVGPSMIAAARRRVGQPSVTFGVTSFEDFDGDEGCFDLVVSATAFHWIDPEVKFAKPARLLRPGGWLALLSTGERYDDPFGSELVEMWIQRSDDDGAWARQRKLSDTEIITASGLFETPVEREHSEAMRLPVDAVIGVENTRATSLSWSEEVRVGFTSEVTAALASQTDVGLVQQTQLTMARRPRI